jgi:hypothetical protein
MISIARGNEVKTKPAHTKSFRPDVSAWFPEPAIEYATTATTATSRKNNPPSVALEAVAAAPQPSLARIRQGGPDSAGEPHEIEDGQAVEHCSDQDAHARADIESGECVGRCADLRLVSVGDVSDDEAEGRLDPGSASQAFPECRCSVYAGGRRHGCRGCAHESLPSN